MANFQNQLWALFHMLVFLHVKHEKNNFIALNSLEQ